MQQQRNSHCSLSGISRLQQKLEFQCHGLATTARPVTRQRLPDFGPAFVAIAVQSNASCVVVIGFVEAHGTDTQMCLAAVRKFPLFNGKPNAKETLNKNADACGLPLNELLPTNLP